jgi:hypothetical protein
MPDQDQELTFTEAMLACAIYSLTLEDYTAALWKAREALSDAPPAIRRALALEAGDGKAVTTFEVEMLRKMAELHRERDEWKAKALAAYNDRKLAVDHRADAAEKRVKELEAKLASEHERGYRDGATASVAFSGDGRSGNAEWWCFRCMSAESRLSAVIAAAKGEK